MTDGSDGNAASDCAHIGVPAGPPWMLRKDERGRGRGIVCEHCGIAWPGHELPTPLDAAERSPGFGALPPFTEAQARQVRAS